MSKKFASNKRAIAECDICGFRYKLKELRKLTINGEEVNTKACPECWNEDHPQNHVGRYPVNDPQAIRDPRPDFAGYPSSRANNGPVIGVYPVISLGSVTITT